MMVLLGFLDTIEDKSVFTGLSMLSSTLYAAGLVATVFSSVDIISSLFPESSSKLCFLSNISFVLGEYQMK